MRNIFKYFCAQDLERQVGVLKTELAERQKVEEQLRQELNTIKEELEALKANADQAAEGEAAPAAEQQKQVSNVPDH